MDTINFTRGVPANESFPTTELIDSAGAVFKTHGTAMLQYGPSRGFEPLRQWLAEWQGVALDRVMTSNGSLQLIEFLCLQMLKPGDLVFTESPSYDRTINLLRRHGAKVVGIRSRPMVRTSRRSRARCRRQCPSSSTSFLISRIRLARRVPARSGGRSPSWPKNTTSCSSKMRRIGCFGIAATKSRRSTSWRRSARCI